MRVQGKDFTERRGGGQSRSSTSGWDAAIDDNNAY
jgi:hypothetical protein